MEDKPGGAVLEIVEESKDENSQGTAVDKGPFPLGSENNKPKFKHVPGRNWKGGVVNYGQKEAKVEKIHRPESSLDLQNMIARHRRFLGSKPEVVDEEAI